MVENLEWYRAIKFDTGFSVTELKGTVKESIMSNSVGFQLLKCQKNVPIFIRATQHGKKNHIMIILTDITLTQYDSQLVGNDEI